MNSSNHSQVCHWCQTEIVWDPEIGPEKACPHCFNDLSAYRSLKLKIDQLDGEFSLEDEEEESFPHLQGHDEDDDPEVEDLLDDYTDESERDDYAERVTACMDQQEYAPECSNCHELMIHAGTRHTEAASYQPTIPSALGTSFLEAPYALDIYVCPSCFKTDEYLTKDQKEAMIRIFKPGSEQTPDWIG